MQPTPWLLRRPGPARPLRLYCFTYAGAGAGVYAPWQEALGPEIDLCAIQLPGRATRVNEAPATDFRALVASIAHVIASQGRGRFAFFGHSLGALLAFEVTRHAMLNLLPLPVQLIVSGCAAPQRRGASRQLHLLPDAELIEALKEYNGTPPEVLAHRELMELVLPVIRADFSLVDNYVYRPGLRLPMPVSVYAGHDDACVTPEQISGWQLEAGGAWDEQWFEGDHFFIHSQTPAVLASIRARLEQRLAA